MINALLNILKSLKLLPESGFGEIVIKIQNGKIQLFEKKEQVKPEAENN